MKHSALFLLSFLLLVSCKPKQTVTKVDPMLLDTVIVDSDQYVQFETTKGTFVIQLFRETPLHRHNMAVHAKYGKYDGQLFFGVEKKFKIQCGDLNSRGAAPGVALGVNEKNDTIPGEINVSRFYHKRGAVGQASLRQVELSTSQQFYIITGRTSTPSDLKRYEEKMNKRFHKSVKDSLTKPYSKQILEYRQKKYNNKISVLNDKLNKMADSVISSRGGKFSYSAEQIEEYGSIGGAANLDGYYTVFGQVVEGMDVVDEICNSRVDKNLRPTPDVKIIKATLLVSYK